MDRQRLMLPAAALACIALLAGCGSSNSSSTSSTSSSTSASPTSSTSSKTATTAPTGGPEIQKAIAECKQIIGSETKIPAAAKSKLEGACAAAAKGDTTAVKKAAREVCEEVIDKSGVPGGAAKEAALKACRK